MREAGLGGRPLVHWNPPAVWFPGQTQGLQGPHEGPSCVLQPSLPVIFQLSRSYVSSGAMVTTKEMLFARLHHLSYLFSCFHQLSLGP